MSGLVGHCLFNMSNKKLHGLFGYTVFLSFICRSGVLLAQTMHLEDAKSIGAYLDNMIGIPAQFFPTFLGLHLAENFELGTR